MWRRGGVAENAKHIGAPVISPLIDNTSAYVFLLLGGVAHLLVDSLKQSREKAGSGLVAVHDWLLWLHVKESSLLMAVIYIWVGFIGLAFSMTGIQWVTAFFVGYSIDSFVDIFLQRFSEGMSAETELIRKELGGEAAQ